MAVVAQSLAASIRLPVWCGVLCIGYLRCDLTPSFSQYFGVSTAFERMLNR